MSLKTQEDIPSSSGNNMAGEQEAVEQNGEKFEDGAERRKRLVDEFQRTFSPWKLLDPQQPWVLVENGSLMGFFDWLPEEYRVGPWSWSALSLLFGLAYLTVLSGAYFASDESHPWFPETTEGDLFYHAQTIEQYPAAWSLKWLYHALGFGWMVYLAYIVYIGPNGSRAWITYTVQSWTFMTFRHGLVALSPWSTSAGRLAEWIRFPVACSQTITFFLWNFAIAPAMYFVILKTERQKAFFWDFCTSFRLLNLHGLNIVLCVLNCGPWMGCPPRHLGWIDFYLAFVSCLAYMGIYLLLLDRMGVHLYPIFSPRTPMVLPAWGSLLAVYLLTFWAWSRFLTPS